VARSCSLVPFSAKRTLSAPSDSKKTPLPGSATQRLRTRRPAGVIA
jgi:hypothetical protein